MNLEQKAAGTIDSLQRTSGGGGCGIVGIGCGIVVALFLTLCISLYFVGMHSSLPLALMERAIEADGKVKVEGLKGSISSGFEMEEMKFQSDENDQWNEVRDVRFKFNGFWDVMRSKRLIINEASVGGATIYTSIDEDGQLQISPNIDGQEIAEELTEEWQGARDDFRDDDLDELKELRIDLLSARNVTLIDHTTGTRLEFNRVEFRDFQMLHGKMTRMGDLQIISDHLDLKSDHSARYPDEPAAWNVKGVIKPTVHKALIGEMPFDVDVAIPFDRPGENMRAHCRLFHGQVELDEPYGDERSIKLADFSPSQYFDSDGRLVPDHWNVQMQLRRAQPESQTEAAKRETKGNESANPAGKPARAFSIAIQPGGSFQLGESRFEIQTTRVIYSGGSQIPATMQPQAIKATADLPDIGAVTAEIRLNANAPWYSIQLKSKDLEPNDLWAQLFYGKDYSQLDTDQQIAVNKTVSAGVPGTNLESDYDPVEF